MVHARRWATVPRQLGPATHAETSACEPEVAPDPIGDVPRVIWRQYNRNLWCWVMGTMRHVRRERIEISIPRN